MGLFWVLVISFLLANSLPGEYHGRCWAEIVRPLNHSHLRLTLYHLHGPGSDLTSQSPLSFYEILAQDQARVRALNFRITKNNTSGQAASTSSSVHKSSENLLRPKFVNIPLNPGVSIGIGNYYVKVGLGTPPKYYPMVVDTGSSFSWLQCKPCTVYCHPQVGPVFDPSASMTYKHLSCSSSQCLSIKDATLNDPYCTPSDVCLYTASYGDSSYSSGYLSQDSLSLAPSQMLPSFVYGCGQDNEGLFGQSAGLIGLARNKLSMLAQLSSKYGYAFSYCLPTATGGYGTGSLSIGRTSGMTLKSVYQFTQMLTDSRDPSLYFLRLAAITVAGRQMRVAASQYRVPTIIDSGTVITRLPASVYTVLRMEFSKIMSLRYQKAPAYSILDACFKGSLKQMSSAVVPKIGMVFQGGANLILGPQNILIEVDKGVTCLAFAGSGNEVAIIGNHQQQTFHVVYDVSNRRIGFAPGGCR